MRRCRYAKPGQPGRPGTRLSKASLRKVTFHPLDFPGKGTARGLWTIEGKTGAALQATRHPKAVDVEAGQIEGW